MSDIPQTYVTWQSGGSEYIEPAIKAMPILSTLDQWSVVIKVIACALDTSDALCLAPPSTLSKVSPFRSGVGKAYAGTVVATGRGVDQWQIGQHVVGVLDKAGACSEYIIVNAESCIVAKPNEVDFTSSAALALAWNTAYAALYTFGGYRQLVEGQTSGASVLILDASTVTGLVVIQLAQQLGLDVSVTCLRSDRDRVKGLGVTVIDDLATFLPVNKFNLVVDLREGAHTEDLNKWLDKAQTGGYFKVEGVNSTLGLSTVRSWLGRWKGQIRTGDLSHADSHNIEALRVGSDDLARQKVKISVSKEVELDGVLTALKEGGLRYAQVVVQVEKLGKLSSMVDRLQI